MDLITVRCKGGKKVEIEVRGHRIECDMGREDGGEDAAPSPKDMLAASLGACIGIMVHGYCKGHGLPCEGIEVNVVPTMGTNPNRIQNLAIDITLPAGFPEDGKEGVLRAAKHCPVHATLEHPPVIDIDIVS